MKSYWQKIQLIAAFGMTWWGIIGYYPMIWMTPVAAIPKTFPPLPPPPDRGAAGDRKAAASRLRFSPPPPPPDGGPVGNRRGAASRGCGVSNQSVIAVVPVYKQTFNQRQTEAISVTKVWGLTNEEYPTFWFFVPYQKSLIDSIEFVVQDESSQTLYRTIVTIPEVPGIVSIRLNQNAPPLQVDKMYHWFFQIKVICNPQQPPEREYVEGWVQRVNPNPQLVDSLKQATPQQRVRLYAENGIWYDALTTLAELRLAKPQDPTLAVDWMNLLKSVDLENLAKQPLIKCCQANAK
ncbi:DUF928 domain-containing protein [Nostoc sp. XA010]|uniref:DUF928 domain-containing protein n=1 Tax=Nostoc sp. XA010 TaxID=2780407 RepID=UPI001E4EFBBA|nr:DUF928 domain-containing protein [Nostoc sp. XA010]MCC5661474.1 DUF928 domain-containing protein [Nostoc sp. XA010]